MTRFPILIAALLCATGASAQDADGDLSHAPSNSADRRAQSICSHHALGRSTYPPGWELCSQLDAARDRADHAFVEQYLKDAGAKQ